ncbi:MAG: MGMT family protein [Verrucomicrobiae bacterium]|nr:MGMT family protein [Verrucomicrobiae bacterium]
MRKNQRKSWQEKLTGNKQLPKIITLTQKLEKRWGKGRMVVPSPKEVDAVMRRVPKGKLITINEIRQKLAKQHRVALCCPVTTGIFAWIAAHAAKEAMDEGRQSVTPYWRTLKTGRFLNEKFPGGIPFLKKKLKEEGHQILSHGKKWVVE